MTIFLFELALLALAGGSQNVKTLTGAANVPARNALEQLVLGPLDDCEKVADWIEGHAGNAAGLQKAMDEIGFERRPDNNDCRNYVYSRVVDAKGLTRTASVVWCKKRPFVLLGSGYPASPPTGRSTAPSTPFPPGSRP